MSVEFGYGIGDILAVSKLAWGVTLRTDHTRPTLPGISETCPMRLNHQKTHFRITL